MILSVAYISLIKYTKGYNFVNDFFMYVVKLTLFKLYDFILNTG